MIPRLSPLACWNRSLSGALVVSALLLGACGAGGSATVAGGSPAVPGAGAPGVAAPPLPAGTGQAVATAVGALAGAATSATIGAAGGRLAASDGKMSVDIPIAQDSWTGTAVTTFAVQTVTAELIWTLEGNDNNVVTYRPSGTASVLATFVDGSPCTISPLTGVIEPSGELIVDYNASPPIYRGGGSTFWPATQTCVILGRTNVNPTTVTALYFGGSKGPSGTEAQGAVSADGTTIEGSDTMSVADVKWTFTRN